MHFSETALAQRILIVRLPHKLVMMKHIGRLVEKYTTIEPTVQPSVSSVFVPKVTQFSFEDIYAVP